MRRVRVPVDPGGEMSDQDALVWLRRARIALTSTSDRPSVMEEYRTARNDLQQVCSRQERDGRSPVSAVHEARAMLESCGLAHVIGLVERQEGLERIGDETNDRRGGEGDAADNWGLDEKRCV